MKVRLKKQINITGTASKFNTGSPVSEIIMYFDDYDNLGGLIVYYLLKPKINVASLQQFNISSLENRLDNIEQNLQQLQQIQLQPLNSPYQLSKNNMTLTT